MNKLGYMNCNKRAVKSYTDKNGKKRSWGRCMYDGKSCREWDMEGYDCYKPREEYLI